MSVKSEHERAMEFLPWYVNETLSDAERALVESHVRHCVPCRLALREQRDLQLALREHPSVHLSAERGFDRLMQRIDGTSSAPGGKGPVNRYFALAASVTLGFVALGAAVYVATGLRPTPDAFETLATTNSRPSARLDVVFADGVTESDLRELLQTFDASLVGGPSAVGRYTIELPGPATSEDLDEVVAALRKDPRIRFAGRSYIEENDPR
jgi:Putative zinc-finger